MGWTVRASIPSGGKRLLSSAKLSILGLRPPNLLLCEYRGSYPGAKELEREADHSPLSSAKV